MALTSTSMQSRKGLTVNHLNQRFMSRPERTRRADVIIALVQQSQPYRQQGIYRAGDKAIFYGRDISEFDHVHQHHIDLLISELFNRGIPVHELVLTLDECHWVLFTDAPFQTLDDGDRWVRLSVYCWKQIIGNTTACSNDFDTWCRINAHIRYPHSDSPLFSF